MITIFNDTCGYPRKTVYRDEYLHFIGNAQASKIHAHGGFFLSGTSLLKRTTS